MSNLTLDDFEKLPVMPDDMSPPFMLAGDVKYFLTPDLAQQQDFVKERKARFFVLHFYEAKMSNSGALSIQLISDTIIDETKPEIPTPDISSYLGKTKRTLVDEITTTMKANSRTDVKKDGIMLRLKKAFVVLKG